MARDRCYARNACANVERYLGKPNVSPSIVYAPNLMTSFSHRTNPTTPSSRGRITKGSGLDNERFLTAYNSVDLEAKGALRFQQVELLLYRLSVFRLVGSESQSAKVLLLQSAEAKRRFIDEVIL